MVPLWHSYSLELVPPWPGLQLKFSFFFGSVVFKKAELQVLKMFYLKILKRLPLYLIRNWILRRCAHRSHVLSSFLSDSEASLLLKKKKQKTLSKFTDIKARYPFHQCQGLFANYVFATLRLRTGPGRDGCQSALWDCFGGRICRYVENACPKQSTMHFDNHHDSVSRATSNWRIA